MSGAGGEAGDTPAPRRGAGTSGSVRRRPCTVTLVVVTVTVNVTVWPVASPNVKVHDPTSVPLTVKVADGPEALPGDTEATFPVVFPWPAVQLEFLSVSVPV